MLFGAFPAPKGTIYTRNRWGESPVYDAAMAEDGSHLAVVTEISGVTHYTLPKTVHVRQGFYKTLTFLAQILCFVPL